MVFTFTDDNINLNNTTDLKKMSDYNKIITSTSEPTNQANELKETKNDIINVLEDNLDSNSNDVCSVLDENTSSKKINNSGRQYCSRGWLKYVMVGKQYQADIPDCLDGQVPPNVEERGDDSKDLLLWDPSGVTETSLMKYLSNASTSTPPKGSHIKDNETALYALMKCKNNVRKAVRMRIQPQPLFPTSKNWTDQECASFEDGWVRFGKDFRKIHKFFLPARSVSEIVHFYYFWKKSARRDMLNSRTRKQKKKFEINPGCIDLMEKFLDEEFIENFRSQNSSCSVPVIL